MTTPIAVAQAEIGYVEQGGSDGRSGNITKFWVWWQSVTGQNLQGQSWCGAFVSWCFDQAGARFTISGAPGFVYCPTGEAWFRSQGLLVDAAHAQPGDVVFFHFANEAIEANHTGIVESIDPKLGTITCIEGNTSSGFTGSQSNGGGVYRRTRAWSVVRSVGHVTWVKPTAPQEDDSMKPVADTPSWCARQADGAFPRFKAFLDGADAVVASFDNAPFAPDWSDGDHGGFVDFVAFGIWCRRFKSAGEPYGFGEVAGSFFLITEHGTYDVAAKAAAHA